MMPDVFSRFNRPVLHANTDGCVAFWGSSGLGNNLPTCEPGWIFANYKLETKDLPLGGKFGNHSSSEAHFTASEEEQGEKELHVGVWCPRESDSHLPDLVHWNDS